MAWLGYTIRNCVRKLGAEIKKVDWEHRKEGVVFQWHTFVFGAI